MIEDQQYPGELFMSDTSSFGASLEALFQTIEARKGADATSSYTARLLAEGPDRVAQKVGEEAVELVIAAAQRDGKGAVAESADLLYHLAVLWASLGITPADVAAALDGRRGVSGLDEKKSRATTNQGNQG